MHLITKHFGDIEVDEEKIINFEEGLPGFEETKKYIIISNDDGGIPFQWLQCIDETSLAFVIIDPFYVRKDYNIEVNDKDLQAIGVEKEEDVQIYSIVVIPEDIKKISVNLKAPLVINVRNYKAMQVILDNDKYTVRHYILDELREQGVAQDACFD